MHLRPVGGNNNDMVDKGYIHRIERDDIVVSFHPSFRNGIYDVQFSFTRTPIRLMHRAIGDLSNSVIDRFVHPQLEPSLVPMKPNASTARLNTRQFDAVRRIYQSHGRSRPVVISGPPGTGKTSTVVAAILQLLVDPHTIILVTAPSNVAADLICDRLRLAAPNLLSPENMLRLNAMMRNPRTLQPQDLLQYSKYDKDQRCFTIPDKSDLSAFRVIVCTCVSAGYLRSMDVDFGHFSHIFVDECGQANEAETMCAVMLADANTTIVLAGDSQQLGPIIKSPIARKFRFDRSALERLTPVSSYCELFDSYRAHPYILEAYSRLFYEGKLVYRADPIEVNSLVAWNKLPNGRVPILFQHVDGPEERSPESPSWFNQTEVGVVAELVNDLLSSGLPITAGEIGIMAPYHQQVKNIMGALQEEHPDVRVATVECFQGEEKKAIFLSTVRSHKVEEVAGGDTTFRLGFVSNPKRLNVAISRAKALLVVVGNAQLLWKHDAKWRELLQYCIEIGAYRGPPLDDPDDNDDDDNNVDNDQEDDEFHLVAATDFL